MNRQRILHLTIALPHHRFFAGKRMGIYCLQNLWVALLLSVHLNASTGATQTLWKGDDILRAGNEDMSLSVSENKIATVFCLSTAHGINCLKCGMALPGKLTQVLLS